MPYARQSLWRLPSPPSSLLLLVVLALLSATPLWGRKGVRYVWRMPGGREVISSTVVGLENAIAAIEAFEGASPELHAYVPPFSRWSTPSKYKPDIFRRLNNSNTPLLLAWAVGSPNPIVSLSKLSTRQGELFKEQVTRRMTAADVMACHSDACLELLTDILQQADHLRVLSREAIAAISGTQLASLVKRVKRRCKALVRAGDRVHCYEVLTNLPETLFDAYGLLMTKLLGNELQYASSKLAAHILQAGNSPKAGNRAASHICAFLTETTVAAWISTMRAQQMSPACVRWLQLEGAVSVQSLKIPATSWSQRRGPLSPQVTALLSGDAIKYFAQEVDSTMYPGATLNLEMLSKGAVERLSPRLLLGRFYHLHLVQGMDQVNLLGDNWKHVNAELLEELNPSDAHILLHALHEDDIKMMPIVLIRTILAKYPSACDIILPQHINKVISITSTQCFLTMQGPTQATTIATVRSLPDATLERISAEQVQQWQYQTHGASLEGLDLLKTWQRGHLPNAENIIASLGVDPEGENPCSLIRGNLGVLEQIRPLFDHMSYACLRGSRITLPTEESPTSKAGRVTPTKYRRLLAMQPFALLRKTHSDDWFKGLTKDVMEDLIKGGRFCPAVDKSTWELIPLTTYDLIDRSCFLQLEDLPRTWSRERVRALSDSLLQTLPLINLPSTMLPRLSPHQLAILTSKTDPMDNLGRALTAEAVSSMDEEQLSVLRASHWQACSPSAFAGIDTPEKLLAIYPGAMVHWDLARVRHIPEKVLIGLTAEQARHIAKASVDSKQVLLYLLERHRDLTKIVLHILSSRSLEEHAAKETHTWIRPVVLAIIALCLILIPLFYYLVRRTILQMAPME